MGDIMLKGSMIFIHVIGVSALAIMGTYIYLNETNCLNKVKQKCKNTVMDIKEDITNNM